MKPRHSSKIVFDPSDVSDVLDTNLLSDKPEFALIYIPCFPFVSTGNVYTCAPYLRLDKLGSQCFVSLQIHGK